MEVLHFCSCFHKSCRFFFLTACRKNFFEKIFTFCYFFHFWSFLLILDKNEQKLGHFDQIYGTSTEMKKNQKMLIFRLQTVLRRLKWRRPCYVTICQLGAIIDQNEFLNFLNFFHFREKLRFFHFFCQKWCFLTKFTVHPQKSKKIKKSSFFVYKLF